MVSRLAPGGTRLIVDLIVVSRVEASIFRRCQTTAAEVCRIRPDAGCARAAGSPSRRFSRVLPFWKAIFGSPGENQ